jgi:Uma2 family endonuclease
MPSACLPRASCRESGNGSTTLPCETNVITGAGVRYRVSGFRADLTALHAKGTPELVIEIGSPGTRKRDETTKRRLYERFGVTEYWVVDPDLDLIRVYRRNGDHFDRAVEVSRERGDVLTTLLLQGLELPLQRIFRE